MEQMLPQREEMLGKLECVISAITSLIGFLTFLSFMKLDFMMFEKNFWEPVVYNVKPNLFLLQVLLFFSYLILKIFLSEYKNILFLMFPLIFFPIQNIEFLISVSCILVAVDTVFLKKRAYNYLIHQMAIIGGLEVLAVLHWLFFYPLSVKTSLEQVALLEKQLFYLFSSFTPYLGLTVIFTAIFTTIYNFKNLELKHSQPELCTSPIDVNHKILVVFLVLISIFSSVYPYNPIINPENIDFGIDVRNYQEHATIVENDPLRILDVWDGSRPIVFLLIYLIQTIFKTDALSVVRLLPMLLNPFLALSTYFLTLELFQNRKMALLSMFFTIAGFPVIINIYSYFLANILGISFLCISFTFLIKALRSNDFTSLFFAYFFGFLLILSHPWTFIQYFIPVLVIMLMIILSFGKVTPNIDVGSKKMLIYYALGLGVTDLIKFFTIRGEGGISALSAVFGFLSTFNTYWSDTVVAFSYMFGGLYSNLVLLTLIIVGILVYKPDNPLDVIIQLSLGFSSVVFLIGNQMIKSRIFFNFPTAILAAKGFLFIYDRTDAHMKRTFTWFVSVTMILYLFRGLATFV